MMKKSIDKNLLVIIPTFYPHLEDGGPIISFITNFTIFIKK